MNFKATVLFVMLVSAAAFAAELNMGKVEVIKGELAQINIENAPYGGAYGTIKLRIGFAEWYPDAVWMIPENSNKGDFSYTGTAYSVPSALNLTNNCRSSIYYNSTLGYAFKSSVKENGTFCILADPGDYKFIAEY
ncbi:MAG: hypothetical protein HY513_03945 [Candidatus Aenigmarchaeota archaeon]|nr:hypothetical protein [Candidatus Aenigmarchaeota archaeon]